MAKQRIDQAREQGSPRTSTLEWISGAIGLALTLAMLSFIGWQAYQGSEGPPIIDVQAEQVVTAAGGWVAEIVAANRSPSTAAAVQVQGELRQGEDVVATSQVTFDYVPGHSEQRGGLYFDQDPSRYELRLRALGYAKP